MNEKDIFKQVCENDFAFYVKHFLKVVEPETNFEWNWHIEVLCHNCEKVFYGEILNLDINIPPRSLKSLIVSVLFPTWIWTKVPSFKIMSASSSFALSNLLNMKRREIIESQEYQSLWPMGFKEDMNKINQFANEFNGFMRAVSVGGSVTGEGADLLLSDDLVDAKNAYSNVTREAANAWYSNVYHGRAQNKKTARRINIMQRLHPKDLSGHIAETYPNFLKLIIPMQKTEKNLSTVDWHDPRQVGEFLHPQRYSIEEKEAEYGGLGIYGWSSQMQQNPVPVGGGIIKEEWIRYYDKLPDGFSQKIISGDLTFKGSKTSDYVCFECWGKVDNFRYLIDIIRGKWSYLETKEHFKTFVAKNHGAGKKFIEDKANGPAMIDDLKSVIPGLEGWPRAKSKFVGMDKVQRLHFVSQDWENGLVLLPKDNPLVDLFVLELTSFTEKGSTTGNDDMVDTATMSLIELKQSNVFFAG